MIDDEFTFYLNHQKELVAGHLDEFVVIKDQKALGYYKTDDEAFKSMVGNKLGTFIVKKCQLPGTDIVNYHTNTVAFS
jgi:hypothetical protein